MSQICRISKSYTLITSSWYEDGQMVTEYGVLYKVQKERKFFFTLSNDREKIDKLIGILNDHSVELCHFEEIAQDFLCK